MGANLDDNLNAADAAHEQEERRRLRELMNIHEKAVTYRVIRDYDLDEFVQRVNLALKEGWQLQGGVCISHRPNDHEIYLQALVMEKR
jgi:hypothetical protein